MGYPYSIPKYNKFRAPSPDTLDTDNPISFVVSNCPPELFRYLVGQVTVLADVTAWREEGAVTPEQLVDAVNGLEINMDFCAMVAECVRSHTGTQDAIRDLINGPTGTRPPDGVYEQTDSPSIDCVWGGCIGLIDYLFAELTTILDALDAATDTLDAAGAYLPDSGYSKAVGAVLEVFLLIENAGSFVIRSSMTTVARDRLACDLFCYILNNTGIDYRVTNDTLLDWADTLGTAQPDQSLNWLVFGVPVSPFIDPISILDESRLISYYILGTEDCSNTWDTLCTCSQWSYTYDFLQRDYNATYRTSQLDTAPEWDAGLGWSHGDYSNVLEEGRFAEINLPAWSTSAVVTDIELEIEIQRGSLAQGNAYNAPEIAIRRTVNTNGATKSRAVWDTLDGIEILTWSGLSVSFSQPGVRIVVDTANFNQACCSGSVRIRRLTLSGTGNPPQIP